MKTQHLLTAICVVFFALGSWGQNTHQKAKLDRSKRLGEAKKSEIFEIELAGEIHTPSADLDWMPTLNSKTTRIKHATKSDELTAAMKASKLLTKFSEGKAEIPVDEKEVFSPTTPAVEREFDGNVNNGSSPMDNSIAISDDGLIVSVANTTIQYKTADGITTYNNSIASFINDPAISYVCDPVVLYDAESDRFIFFAQECSGNSSNSHLLILFSQTNDPADGWNYYKLTGNPLDDNSWFDYPKLAISDTELFITGNLFTDDYYYNQSVVYQMEKTDGYAGISLTWQYWSDIPGDPGTLLVVSSGSEFNYGPGIYIVSTNPYYGNSIKFYDITDNIAGSPTMDYYSVATTPFEVAADSEQLGTGCMLDNGDSRCLSGFYLNGVVHFVFQSDAGSGWNGINYNRLNVTDLDNTSKIYGNPGVMDYSYPSLSWFGLTPDDQSVMIGFGSVSSVVYPQMRVVHCNNEMEFSESTLVHESDSYASFTSPTKERWGDYTGMARRHNAEEPTVWMSGMYGTFSNRWNTWIAEIQGTYFTGVEEVAANENGMVIAPNPVVETFILYFETTAHTPVEVNIYDLNGALVKNLYQGIAYAGKNEFAFNKSNLATGTYILRVESNQKAVANEKIIIQ